MIKLLADPTRQRIVELLADGAACTCHLVEDTGAKQPTVSHHLKLLREAGLVEAEPYGRFTYYRLVPEGLDATAAELTGLAVRARGSADQRRAC